MNQLVIYYSRTGTTKIVAEKVAGMINADIEEIIDKKSRAGVLGYLSGGKDAAQKKLTDIEPLKKDPTAYELVVVGTPVWVGTMAPAIRTILSDCKGKFKKLAFFTTQGGANLQRVFADMEALSGIQPEAILMLETKEVKASQYEGKIRDFVNNLS